MNFLEKNYTTTELLKVIDITRTRLRPWIERGYVFPSVMNLSTQGTKHLYSIEDLYGAAVFKYLLEFGFSRDRAGVMIKNWKFFGEWEKKHHALFYIDDKKFHSTLCNFEDQGEADKFFQAVKESTLDGKSTFIINVSDVIEGVNQRIKELL